MNSWYLKWLHQEKEWIAKYQRKIMLRSCFQIIPSVLVLLALLFGGISYFEDGTFIEGASNGAILGGVVSSFYLIIMLIFLRPGRYVRKIKSTVKGLNLNDLEREELGHEMLQTQVSTWRSLYFTYDGHGSNQTPACFRVTPHYAILIGGFPYANLVKLSEVTEALAEEEEKTTTIRGSQTTTYERFTLYTIVFYGRDENGRGSVANWAMGFYEKEIRDKAMKLLQTEEV